MYRSVIRGNKFLVHIVDGVAQATLMELPTEELADRVAFELQTAWDEGIEWGINQKQKELLGYKIDPELREYFHMMRSLALEEREAHQRSVKRQRDETQMVTQRLRWEMVLSWKSYESK
ncbi:hypothetical protein [Paenibacillus silvisoli]|uniref:hypothetical protein n=1 Tax=Paenibacillus silvisoli TaxID=3110539 RepID=UPI0028046BF0|nr:hypothetical protein [Paenibacillus silvisoli]